MIQNYIQSPHIFSHRLKEPGTAESGLCKKKNGTTSAQNCEYKKSEPENVNFCGLSNSSKLDKLYKNKNFHSVLKFAKDKQIVFSAGFALLLTCILRPAAIVLSPSKKNKEDQKYASAHSIASGLIGFGISSIILAPVTNGIKEFTDHPGDYITNKNNFLLKKGPKKELANKTAGDFMSRIFTDILPAIPKGILTIALIPPILKYVFGVQKKKTTEQKQGNQANVDFSLLHFKSTDKTTSTNKTLGGNK